MANETKSNKLTYNQLQDVASQLQRRNADLESTLQRINDFREMTALCVELLKYFDVLHEGTQRKILDFIDRVVPTPKEEQTES